MLWTPYLIMPISIYGVRGMMMPVPSAAIAKPSYMSSMLAQWPYRLDATTIAMMQCSGRSLLLSQTIFYQQKHSLPTSLTTSFPIPTSSRPDIVWWDDTKKKPEPSGADKYASETSFDGAAERKQGQICGAPTTGSR